VWCAGARGGEPETLKGLSRHYEARQRMIRQARSAMIYPTIVLIIATAVVLLITIFVIPKMVGFIADSMRGKDVELPWPTQVLMSISRFMTAQGWWIVPLAVVGAVFGGIWAYRTPAGKVLIDGLSLYVPILGKIRKKIETTRFARTLAALLNAGVDVGTSLDLTSDVLGLSSFRRAISGVKAEVMHGSELSEAIEDTRCFPSDVVAIINSGEETGKLPESLDKIADDYEEQVEYMIKNLGNLIQPVLMVVMGGIVLFIVLGVILAYLQMLTSAM
jgi:type IV pilus assembly protein PilC